MIFHEHKFKVKNVARGEEKEENFYSGSLLSSQIKRKTVKKTYILLRCDKCGQYTTNKLDGHHPEYLFTKSESDIEKVREHLEKVDKQLA